MPSPEETKVPGTVNNNSPHATITDRLGALGLIIAVVSVTLQVSGYFNQSNDLIASQKEVARLNTLVLNHEDKLDKDTQVAQQLLAAATTMLSSCKK